MLSAGLIVGGPLFSWPVTTVPARTAKSLFSASLLHSNQQVGDLFYLDVRTLEGSVYYITAWSRGFYVNGTKQGGVFDPNPVYLTRSFHGFLLLIVFSRGNGLASHNLAELLTKLSPKFAEGFSYLLNVYFDAQSLDYAPVSRPVIPWLAQREEHRHDTHRSEMDAVHFHLRDFTYLTFSLG